MRCKDCFVDALEACTVGGVVVCIPTESSATAWR